MADNTPVTDPVTSAQKVEDQPEVATTDQPIEVPTFAKATPEIKEEPKSEAPEVKEEPKEAPVPQETDEQATLKKRLSGAISEVEKKNEEVRKIVDLQVELVTTNPDLIHRIAATDPVLANKVIQKVWGATGVRSYKQLVERVKLEELKEENPELYETKKELTEIKDRLTDRETRERESIRKSFFSKKGILENEYDPNFVRLQNALDRLNPSFIQEDYEKALEFAHKMEFSEEPVIKKESVPTLSVGGGVKPAPLPETKPPVSEQSSWLAAELNKARGYNIKL